MNYQLTIDGEPTIDAGATPETPADRLREAAQYVADHHGRQFLVDDCGNVCAVGAILRLRSVADMNGNMFQHPMWLLATDPVADEAVSVLAEYVGGPAGSRPTRVPGARVALVESWNDGVARDGAEVAAAMEKAAARWEEKA